MIAPHVRRKRCGTCAGREWRDATLRTPVEKLWLKDGHSCPPAGRRTDTMVRPAKETNFKILLSPRPGVLSLSSDNVGTPRQPADHMAQGSFARGGFRCLVGCAVQTAAGESARLGPLPQEDSLIPGDGPPRDDVRRREQCYATRSLRSTSRVRTAKRASRRRRRSGRPIASCYCLLPRLL